MNRTLYDKYGDCAVVYPDGVKWYKSIINGNEVRHPDKDSACVYCRKLGYVFSFDPTEARSYEY